MISIALTTYNGIKYIKEQLDSIKNQSRLPDQVVIVDDCSADGTFEYIQAYIRDNALSNWFITQNKTNQGWKINFRIALKKCIGELVFLCDQDDIWYENKVQMCSEMEQNPRILLLASNYSVLNIDREDKVKIRGLKRNDGSVKKLLFKKNSLTIMRPGCTYCIRRSLINALWKNDLPNEPHDLMLWDNAVINDGLYLLNRITMDYRRHSDSASAPEDSINLVRRCQEITESITLFYFLAEVCEQDGLNDKAAVIRKHIKFMERRRSLLNRGSVLKMLAFQVLNFQHYATLRNLLSDDYIILRGIVDVN